MNFKSDSYKLKKANSLSNLSTILTEKNILKLEGTVFAYLTENNVTQEIDLGKNIITLNASVLIARLLKDSTATKGLLYLAVGTGAIGWNLQSPPAAVNTQTQLEAELYRKTFVSTNFVKTDGSGDPSTQPTNIIDLVTTFDVGEAVGPIVEMGLFGGDATGVPNSGTLFNHKTFPVINKGANSILTFVWRITT